MGKKGYTLLELIVVISIIALLIAGGVTTYTQLMKQSRDGRRKADLENMRSALEIYRSNVGSYIVGSGNPSSIISSALTGGTTKYMKSIPVDQRSPSYRYYYDGSSSNYSLCAYLEIPDASPDSFGSCTVGTCNYCVGPYGR